MRIRARCLALCLALCFVPALVARAQEVLVGSWATQDVRRYGLDGSFRGVLVAPGAGGLTTPDGLAYRGDSLFVASAQQGAVLEFDLFTGAFRRVFASTGLGRAGYCAFGPDGDLYVCDASSNAVRRYDGVSGLPRGVFASGAGMNFPAGLAWHNGTLLVAGFSSNAVHRFDAASGASLGTIAGVTRPLYLRVASDGLLHVSEYGANRLGKFSLATGARVGSFAAGGLNGPVGQLALPDGSLLVTSWNNGRILRYNEPATQLLGTFDSTLAQPNDLLLVPTIPAPGAAGVALVGALVTCRRRRT
jgi:glucose/arabinose dehydrogenase